ncbi:MAG: AAA family ATPase, partial [Candidatus Liptonbacteria bacterium]|nr:AAA family ATPase [Candidatus Liptonbacteria bacterium]
ILEAERRLFKLRGDLAGIGDIDEALRAELQETETRYKFLAEQCGDLERARADLARLIGELTQKVQSEFASSLKKVNAEFQKFFALMFDGGRAELQLARPPARTVKGKPTPDEEPAASADTGTAPKENAAENEMGIGISVHLPRKRLHSLETLSGGERSLVGIAALFALISVSPPPFLVLDEIDAALDDRNAQRFAHMLKEFSHRTQFIVVTHNRATMEAADVLYGVTTNDDGTSKILSLKFETEPAVSG